MAKLTLDEKCELSPNITAKNIPNPHLIYPEIKNLLIERVGIKETDINEKSQELTKMEGKDKIKIKIEATKKQDKYCKIIYEIELEMEMKPVNKGDIKTIGDAKVKIKAGVKTEYPQDSKFQKSLLGDMFRTFYEKALHKDIRSDYMKTCTNNVMKLRDEIQAFFNLMPKMA